MVEATAAAATIEAAATWVAPTVIAVAAAGAAGALKSERVANGLRA